jgi:hypothetical protein
MVCYSEERLLRPQQGVRRLAILEVSDVTNSGGRNMLRCHRNSAKSQRLHFDAGHAAYVGARRSWSSVNCAEIRMRPDCTHDCIGVLGLHL